MSIEFLGVEISIAQLPFCRSSFALHGRNVIARWQCLLQLALLVLMMLVMWVLICRIAAH